MINWVGDLHYFTKELFFPGKMIIEGTGQD